MTNHSLLPSFYLSLYIDRNQVKRLALTPVLCDVCNSILWVFEGCNQIWDMRRLLRIVSFCSNSPIILFCRDNYPLELFSRSIDTFHDSQLAKLSIPLMLYTKFIGQKVVGLKNSNYPLENYNFYFFEYVKFGVISLKIYILPINA